VCKGEHVPYMRSLHKTAKHDFGHARAVICLLRSVAGPSPRHVDCARCGRAGESYRGALNLIHDAAHGLDRCARLFALVSSLPLVRSQLAALRPLPM
jgi:hypothetical protein